MSFLLAGNAMSCVMRPESFLTHQGLCPEKFLDTLKATQSATEAAWSMVGTSGVQTNDLNSNPSATYRRDFGGKNLTTFLTCKMRLKMIII